MKIAAVIAEYNPFHSGHAYQLEKIREEGIDCIVVVMSGNFLQRGIPSIFDKHDRTKMALENGADLVIELPVFYSTGSAEYFAKGAVNILEGLDCIDYLYFGSESGDISSLIKCAEILNDEPSEFRECLNSLLKSGTSFPKARAMALKKYLGIDDELASGPNNILGIEYIRALLKAGSRIEPRTIRREGSGYNDTEVAEGMYASASGIRALLEQNESGLNDNCSLIRRQVPESVYKYLKSEAGCNIIAQDDFSQMLYYQLVSSIENKSLMSYYDINQQIADIFAKKLEGFKSWSQFALDCKSKEYTYARINRCLMHVLLQIKSDDVCKALETDSTYARILGFTSAGKAILGIAKVKSRIPVISKLADAHQVLNAEAYAVFEKDLFATKVYNSVVGLKYDRTIENEYRKQIIRL